MDEEDGGPIPLPGVRLMTPRAPHALPFLPTGRAEFLTSWRTLAAVGLIALSTAGCLKRGSPEVTGSLSAPQQTTPEAWRQHVDTWGPRFEANPLDATAALQYARGLRALDQKAQAVAVLQQAAMRNP